MNQSARVEFLEERVKELEGILSFSTVLGLRRYFSQDQSMIVGLLLRHEIVPRAMLYAALYNGRPEADLPEDKTLDVRLSHLRKKLTAHGVKLRNRFNAGWYLDALDKARLRELCQ